MKKYTSHVEPFAEGYLNAEHDDSEYRIASGMREYMKYMPIHISDGHIFAGYYNINENIGARYVYGNALTVDKEKFQNSIKAHPEHREELSEMLEKILPLSTNAIVHENETEEEKRFCEMRVSWGGAHWDWQGHSNPDFSRVIRLGTDGIRELICKYKSENSDKEIFYDSLLITLDGLDIWAERYRALALDMAGSADESDKARLIKIASALENVPKKPAKNLFEACQAFWLVFCMDGVDSPGRFDQYMIDYYRAADEAERSYCLEGLWQLFNVTRAWNLCIGGCDENWNDESNELTYDILRIARKYKYNTPNLTLRVHRGTPDALWESAVQTIETGIGMPAIYNDECVCAALEALGITPEDSHDYCMNGCNQIDIMGKSHMGLEDGEVCLAKCLELALYNGVCGFSGTELGLKTGDIKSFSSFDELFTAYKKQVEYATDIAVGMANRTQEIASVYGVNPLRSCLIEGCIERGLDYKNRGPIYGHAQILAEGIADAVDSLAAIEELVFDKKKYTLEELTHALRNDFIEHEEMYNECVASEKFGNDSERVNGIYKKVMEHFYGYLLTKRAFRGGYFGGGCSTFNRTATFAAKIGALPNGKKRSSLILADSIGAVPGCDVKGPTALINSVLSANQTLAKSGNVLQLKFDKKLFESDEGRAAFLSLAKTYFAGGGQQLSINILSREELLDAIEHPEAHKDLIVRVGGYSDYFTSLSPGLQENIIKRTELCV